MSPHEHEYSNSEILFVQGQLDWLLLQVISTQRDREIRRIASHKRLERIDDHLLLAAWTGVDREETVIQCRGGWLAGSRCPSPEINDRFVFCWLLCGSAVVVFFVCFVFIIYSFPCSVTRFCRGPVFIATVSVDRFFPRMTIWNGPVYNKNWRRIPVVLI